MDRTTDPAAAAKRALSPRRAALAGLGVLLLGALVVGAWRLWTGPAVAAYIVERRDLLQTLVATGRVESPRRVEIGSPVTGTVARVLVDEGDSVRAGQLLIALDDAEARAAVAQARAAVSQAEAKRVQLRATALPVADEALRQAGANFENAERSLARSRELLARGFVGQAALDEAQRARDVAASQLASARVQREAQGDGGSDVRMAATALETARAALKVAEARLDLTTIEAPADGTILARNVEKGAIVQPGKSLLVLSPAGGTQLVVQVDERNIPLLRLGAPALASADAYPERRFDARVAVIDPAVDPVRGSIQVKLDVEKAPDYLRQDMTVSVDVQAGHRTGVLTLPADALRTGDWVLAVRGGRTVKQPVRVGARGEGRVEIVEGLSEGEAVIPASRANVHEGQPVRAASAPPA